MNFAVGLLVKFGFLALAIGGVFIGKKFLSTSEETVIEEVAQDLIKDDLGITVNLTGDTTGAPESELAKEITYYIEDGLKKLN